MLRRLALLLAVLVWSPMAPAQEGGQQGVVVQTAVVNEDHGYLNLSSRGGRPGGGVAGDGTPALQQAALTATFSNFNLNGIPYAIWTTWRQTQTVDQGTSCSAGSASETSSSTRERGANSLIGVKKNGTSNGVFGGKVKAICVRRPTTIRKT